jgi:choline dehydrogenase
MIDISSETRQTLLDQAAMGRLHRRNFLSIASAAGLAGALAPGLVEQAFVAGEAQAANRAALRASYDYIVVGGGTTGCVLAAELSKSGAQVLLIESGGGDDAPTILNPSIWFYNIGGALDYKLAVTPVRS